MQLIVITKPEILKNEAETINLLFKNGMQTLHLRKPNVPLAQIEKLIHNIDLAYHCRIVIHDHFAIAERFKLKGVHLTYRTKHHIKEPLSGFTKSISCHSIEEIEQVNNRVDYAFLSPVFDSISKQGYRSNIKLIDLKKQIKHMNVYALGGIDIENIKSIKETGFTGIAVIGALWNAQNIIEQFKTLKNEAAK